MSAAAGSPTTSASGVRRRAGVKADVLIAAAHRLVLEHGENFTTQDLIREADVGLQTLYRNFGSKDQLLVTVMGELISAQCDALRERASTLDGPVERLRFYVTETLTFVAGDSQARVAARFLSSQRWRLHQRYPEEVEAATLPFAELLEHELSAASAAGLLASSSPDRDAALMSRLVLASFHHHLFADTDGTADAAAEEVWRFCLAAVAPLRG